MTSTEFKRQAIEIERAYKSGETSPDKVLSDCINLLVREENRRP